MDRVVDFNDLEDLEALAADFFERCRVAKLIGIPLVDALRGEAVPVGWYLDDVTHHFLPLQIGHS